MLKVVLVDDEILVLKLLEKFISTNTNIQVIGSYTKVSVALKEIPKLKPDVAFLDIEMPGLNGIELATKLIKEDEEMDMVFVTAYEQYAINAFQLNAINYILKPIDQDSVDETIKRLLKKRGKREEQSNKDVKIELFGDICIIEENENRKVKWMTNKVEELFALLIINRKSGVSKWKIIDLLWGEINSKKAEQSLYTTIFRLKKALKEIGIHVSIKNNTGIYNIYLKDI
ncbi:MAG: response regulator, partial [Clostridia bacterium]|nr:response regulator [Clostridia bacterium]